MCVAKKAPATTRRRGSCCGRRLIVSRARCRAISAFTRVFDAIWPFAKRCFAEPGPYQTQAFVTAPALQRTAPQLLRAALRPGHESLPFTKL
jgi:hypothetical protein